eukprot:scaffold37839_cov281-Isochrysis_galbana.AAC.1
MYFGLSRNNYRLNKPAVHWMQEFVHRPCRTRTSANARSGSVSLADFQLAGFQNVVGDRHGGT